MRRRRGGLPLHAAARDVPGPQRLGSQPLFAGTRLVPGRGWVDATSRGEHRAEVRRLDAVVRRYARDRGAGEAVQSARAVRIGHRHALRDTRREIAERRAYRRADARALTTVQRTVPRAR